MGFYAINRDLFTEKAASDITSEPYWVGDAETVGVSIRGSPSTTTIQASLESGHGAALVEAVWSTLTTIISPSPDLIDIAPYAGWIRAQRSETTAFILGLRVRV